MLFTKLIRNESGNAMAMALGVLAVTGVMTGSVFTVSARLSDSSNQSRDQKKALSAADAGLEAAVYRMNKQNLQNTTDCFTTGLVAKVAGECPGQSGSLGNGASYTYHVTPALGAGDTCAGVPISYTGSGAITIVQRCVTAAGTANGVTRRIQARVASYIGLQLFSLGILGLNEVTMQNSSNVAAWIGSNGKISLGNSNTVTGLELGPSASSPTLGNSSAVGSVTRRSVAQGNHVLAPVDVGNSATVNDNARITNGQDASSGVTYNPTTRFLTLGNSSSITLGGGTYNFCKLEATNSATLNIAVGVMTRIFIDSPNRPGSGCTQCSGSGTLIANNSITFNNPGPAQNLQIYVWGRTGQETGNGNCQSNMGEPDVQFNNSVTFSKGFIYAPQSDVVFKNSATVVGAVAAKDVEFKNSVNFTWDTTLTNLRAKTLSMFYKTAWKECWSKQPNASDPESGCTTS
jgi:Tfp pilus assembly protein PilX